MSPSTESSHIQIISLHSTTADAKDPVDCLSFDLYFMWWRGVLEERS